MDAVEKARAVAAALPAQWKTTEARREDFQRLAGYLSRLGQTAKGVGREPIQQVADLLAHLGFKDAAADVKKARL